MAALVERAAGLDVHQGSVVACGIIGAAGRRPTKEVRSFGAMRQDLAALRARPNQGQLPARQVPPAAGAHGREEGRRRGRP